jgi:hypothetical protein
MSKAGPGTCSEAVICCLGGKSCGLQREWTGHCSWALLRLTGHIAGPGLALLSTGTLSWGGHPRVLTSVWCVYFLEGVW